MHDRMVLRPRNGLSLCAGGGGLDMGLMLAEPGFHTRCFVEWEEYPRSTIIAAQRAGYFDPAPIWDDVTTFDGRPLRGAIDTILAGYPCQPFSHAGQRRGADDERHLWPDVARIIREVQPTWVFLENVAGHVSLGAETVLRELWDMGWTPAAGLFSAQEVGAPHERLRWFCVAYRSDTGSSRAGGQPQRGGTFVQSGDGGGSDVDHAAGARPHDARGWADKSDGQQGRQPMPCDGRPELDHPQRDGQQPRREDHARNVGHDAGAADQHGLADAGRTGSQGRERRGSPDERNRTAAHGPAAERGGLPLFPPGPADAAAWATVLQSSPHLAPSASARDCLTRARSLEALGREWWEAEAEPEFRRMVDGVSSRTGALRLLGNAVVPISAAYAWKSLTQAHGLDES